MCELDLDGSEHGSTIFDFHVWQNWVLEYVTVKFLKITRKHLISYEIPLGWK
jgi:hypothetical protein